MRNQASPFHLGRPPLQHQQVHSTFRGTSVPSVFFGWDICSIHPFFGWDICSSLSSSVADCLFGHGTQASLQTLAQGFFCLNHFHCHRVIFIPALVWIRGSSSSRSIGRLVSAPLVCPIHVFVSSCGICCRKIFLGFASGPTVIGPHLHETTPSCISVFSPLRVQ